MKFSYINYSKESGFTLMELLLYISLVSIFTTGAIMFSWDIIYGREKANYQQIAEQNARIALAKIFREVKKAKNIQSISPSQLVLNNGDYNTTIAYSLGKLQIIEGGSGPYNITSNQVKVSDPQDTKIPIFTNLSTSDSNSKNVEIYLSLFSAQGQSQTISTASASVEPSGQFNQARSLLMDASKATLSNANRDITNSNLENSGPTSIAINTITVSWTSAVTGTKINDISINSTSVWSGNADSGTVLTLNTPVTILSGTNKIPINWFRFNKDMTGSVVTIIYTMSDNSTKKIIIVLS